MKNLIFLSIGSNIGNRIKNIKSSVAHLTETCNIKVVNFSNLYESEPLYNIKQRKFYNIVVKCMTNLKPNELLNFVKDIEFKIGRKPKLKLNMPRIIDIDILTYDDICLNTSSLQIPHPKLNERKFVLMPWLDISPTYIITRFNKNVQELMDVIKDNTEVKIINNKRIFK